MSEHQGNSNSVKQNAQKRTIWHKALFGGAVCGLLGALQGCGPEVKVIVPEDLQAITLDAVTGEQGTTIRVGQQNKRKPLAKQPTQSNPTLAQKTVDVVQKTVATLPTAHTVVEKKVKIAVQKTLHPVTVQKVQPKICGDACCGEKPALTKDQKEDLADAQRQIRDLFANVVNIANIRTKKMPTCTDCGKPTVMVAYNCYKSDCHKNVCANCADKPKCQHSWPLELKAKAAPDMMLPSSALPVGPKGADGYTYWPNPRELDTVMCDVCFAHLEADVQEWANTNNVGAIVQFAKHEHNKNAPGPQNHETKLRLCQPPIDVGFNRRGHGVMNHDGTNAVYLNEDRTVHVCPACHHKMTKEGKKPDELFIRGWRKESLTIPRFGCFPQMTLPALSPEAQAKRETELIKRMNEKIGKVKTWERMEFKRFADTDH